VGRKNLTDEKERQQPKRPRNEQVDRDMVGQISVEEAMETVVHKNPIGLAYRK
jgi:hypothetical protein